MAMQRWVTTLVGAAVVLLAVWLVARNFQPPKAIGKDPHPPAVVTDAGTMQALGAALSADGGLPLLLTDLLNEPGLRVDAGVGATLFDGSPVPPLPLNAPRQVRFGIVLVSYEGAQPNPTSGRVVTRSKADARALAQKLYATAQQDFHAAVQQGDGGSSDDVGRVKLGIMEPAPEYVLFSLPIDGVGGPVDTPRGFWIVKRIE
jgi:PPIC-type PPIASE domain